MKNVVILGSTGSIGLQALDVIRKFRDRFKVCALSCYSNIDVIESQAREFDVDTVAVYDRHRGDELRSRVGIDVLSGIEGIIEISEIEDADIVLNSLVGSIGILPTMAAIRKGKDVAIANKETLVSAGEIVVNEARKRNVKLFPVDSEHSAIFQCMNGEKKNNVKRLVLTCSGGAFRNNTLDELYKVSIEDALAHPNWKMGKKITVDSATLMNKGFEVIEAKMLFGVSYEDIEVVVHPQSIVHSLVEFVDNSTMAQLSSPDMRLPIQYALTFPDRYECECAPLDYAITREITFAPPDKERFPCLDFAYEAGKIGGSLPCVLNAANEIAVDAFVNGRIGFMDIPCIIRKSMDEHAPVASPCIEEILDLDYRMKSKVMCELDMQKFYRGGPVNGTAKLC